MTCTTCGDALAGKGTRGLCDPCYTTHHYRGLHLDFERVNRRQEDTLAEWELLSAHGHRRRDVAERLGMSLTTFERACTRARATRRARATQTHADSLSACL